MAQQYTRQFLGAKDQLTCANYLFQRTVCDYDKRYPEAAKVVLENFYMNDYLDSVKSPERALISSKELVHLLVSLMELCLVACCPCSIEYGSCFDGCF